MYAFRISKLPLKEKIIVCLFGANISIFQTFFRYHLHVDGIISFFYNGAILISDPTGLENGLDFLAQADELF